MISNFTRKCPICDITISYSNKYSMMKADKKNSNCKSCGLKLSITDDRRERMRQRVLGENNPMYGKFGELNPFFNKHHTEESKQKIREKKDYSVYKTEEFRNKLRNLTSGENNPMYGKSVYDVWVEKYGEETANIKLMEFKITQSKNSSGRNNPMYGKPSPVGSGNGWSGWYNGWFFRSIKELSYMINVIEKYNLKWVSAESNLYQMNYVDYKGNNRTYTADFILNDKYLIEIKPKKLWGSDSVIRKKTSAINFCKENNLIYKLRDTPNLSSEKLKKLYNTKQIIFTDRYEKKFINKYINKTSK
jgi:hypothetical protein